MLREHAWWVHPGARGISEIRLKVDYDKGEIVVGRTAVFRLETFFQNFVSCLWQSVSRLTKLMDSLDHELLGVTSEEPVWWQNEEVIVESKLLPHNFRLRDNERLVLSVAKSSSYCELTLNFATENSAVRSQNSLFFVRSWRWVIWAQLVARFVFLY